MIGRPKQTTTTGKRQKSGKKRKPAKLSRLHKPEDMSLEDWQIELRRQFGREQNYRLKNVGDHPLFSEFEVRQPAEPQRLPRPHPRPPRRRQLLLLPRLRHQHARHLQAHRVHAGHPGAQARRRPALRAGFQPPYSEVFLQYGAAREVRFRPGSDCPVELARLAAQLFRRRRRAAARRLRPLRDVPDRGAASSNTTCAAATTCWPSSPRCATPSAAGSSVAEAFPRGIRSAAFKDLLKVDPVRLPARRRPVRRPGRPLPDRRRDGPGQDDPGHRRRRDHGPALRRRARPDRLPHVAQAPVAARDRALHRPRRPRSSAACGRAAQPASPADAFFKITNYDTVHRRPRPDRTPGRPTWSSSTRPSASRTGARAPPAASRRSPSPYAIVLTGTPLENRLEELISIVQFVDRYRLGPTFRLLHEHQVRDDGRQGGRLPATWTASARRWRRSCCAARRTRCSTSCRSGSTTTSSCR